MVRRSAGSALLVLGATAVAVGLGGAALAGPGGAPTALTPTSELSASGGVTAPGEAVPDGAAEAPVTQPVPETAPVEPAPVEAAPPAAVEPAPVPQETATAEQPAPAAQEELEAATPEATDPADAPPDEADPVVEPAMPTSAEMLAGEQRPLVPVAVLSAPVESASEGDPLVDMAEPDAEVRAVAAQEAQGEGEGEDQDEDEIVIPVDPDDAPDGTDDDRAGGEGEDIPGIHVPATSRPREQLALTGLALEGPLGAGLVLLLLGGMLRITARPTSGPAPA